MTTPASPSPSRAGWLSRLLAATTLAYAVALVWATHHPKPQDLLGANPPSDKLLHVAVYTVLGGLVALSLAAAGRLDRRRALAAAVGLAVFAVLDEATQPLPWFRRAADPVDWAFDLVGIALGMAAAWAVAAAVSSWASARGSRPGSPT